MPPKNKETWRADHDTNTTEKILLHAIVNKILTSRREIYATRGLEGVTDHGGERINKKIQAGLRAMCGPYAGIVDEEVKAIARARRNEKERRGEASGGRGGEVGAGGAGGGAEGETELRDDEDTDTKPDGEHSARKRKRLNYSDRGAKC